MSNTSSNNRIYAWLTGLLISCICVPVIAQEMVTQQKSRTDLEKWFEDDTDFEKKALQVNEGELHFLPNPPADKQGHSITNTITITQSSLSDHWIQFRQCHDNLDPVAQSEIVYRYKAMRNLHIERSQDIKKVWVENQSIQMEDIAKGARLCVLADARIFMSDSRDGYVIRNGPYYLKFLDGFYPFHLRIIINYPDDLLNVKHIQPKHQPGFQVMDKPGSLVLDTWFEGMLTIEAEFTLNRP